LNPAEPASGTVLCAIEALDDPGTRGFVYRAGQSLFAGFLVRLGPWIGGYVDSCPHAGWRLAAVEHQFLTRDRDFILCSGHGALFRLHDGSCVAGPCIGRALKPWPIRVDGTWVLVA